MAGRRPKPEKPPAPAVVAIELPGRLHEVVQQVAEMNGRTIHREIESLLESALERREREQVRDQINALTVGFVHLASLVEGVIASFDALDGLASARIKESLKTIALALDFLKTTDATGKG